MSIYYQTRLDLRKRQIGNDEDAPLSLITINCDIEIFSRLVRWLDHEHQEVSSWNLVQESHVNAVFIDVNSPRVERNSQKDFMSCSSWPERRKLITYIPMADYPARELPPTTEPLSMAEQRRVARILTQSVHVNPLGCLFGLPMLFHGAGHQANPEHQTFRRRSAGKRSSSRTGRPFTCRQRNCWP